MAVFSVLGHNVIMKKFLIVLSICITLLAAWWIYSYYHEFTKYTWYQCEHGYFSAYLNGGADMPGYYFDSNGKPTEGLCGFFEFTQPYCPEREQKIGKCIEITGMPAFKLYTKTGLKTDL